MRSNQGRHYGLCRRRREPLSLHFLITHSGTRVAVPHRRIVFQECTHNSLRNSVTFGTRRQVWSQFWKSKNCESWRCGGHKLAPGPALISLDLPLTYLLKSPCLSQSGTTRDLSQSFVLGIVSYYSLTPTASAPISARRIFLGVAGHNFLLCFDFQIAPK